MIVKSKRLTGVVILFILLIFPVSVAAAKYVVVIDPGHGGSDMGVKLSKNIYEKDVTLAIAKLVRKNLSGANGIEVRLTRSDDKNVSPANRRKLAGKSDANLFISLHVNAGFGLKARGYEIYYPSASVPSVKKSNSGEILKDMNQTRRLNSCVRLAQIIQKNMGKVFPREGRGLINAPVLVLQSMTAPAVLLEMGFATNLENKKKLRDKKIQQSVADALSKSIKKYFSTDGAS